MNVGGWRSSARKAWRSASQLSFNLSYQRLPEATARVFRALAVFPASFDAAAVEAITEDAGHQHLRELLRRNLVNYDAAAQRYRLHDLARLFAAAQASDDERASWQKRHARHFCDLLEVANGLYLQGGEQVSTGLALYDRESANIAAGQAWATNRADADADDAAAWLCVEYPNAGAYVLSLRLHPRERIRWLDAQLSAARKLKRRDYEGAALGTLGLAYEDLGEVRKAIEFQEQYLIICREIGDRHGEGNAFGNLGSAYYFLGETRKAIKFSEQALVVLRKIGDRRGEGAMLGNLGVAHNDLGETRKAIEFHEQALVIHREIGNRHGEGSDLGNLGNVCWNLGETRKAIEFYGQCLILHREIGDRHSEGNDLGNLGAAYADLGETRKAIEFYEQYLAVAREIGDRRGEGNALWNMALTWRELGDLSASHRLR